MKRPIRPDELKLWVAVTATVRPGPGRKRPKPPPEPVTEPTPPQPAPAARPAKAGPGPKPRPRPPAPPPPPSYIEPNRKRRIIKEREDIGARLDLHGMDQDRARAALHAFLKRAHEDGHRAVLVITGKGALGDGILRRRAPDWLADPAVRPLVAGVSEAARNHGGAGALYVALRRGAK